MTKSKDSGAAMVVGVSQSVFSESVVNQSVSQSKVVGSALITVYEEAQDMTSLGPDPAEIHRRVPLPQAGPASIRN
jgi:hypothetical protein